MSTATASAPTDAVPAADPVDPAPFADRGGRPDGGGASMRCATCGQTLFLDSTTCVRCGTPSRFDPDQMGFVEGIACANAELIDCNWTAPSAGELCRSCALTRTTPDQGEPGAMAAWANAELHKRRLVLQLLQLGLPVVSFRDRPVGGLGFDLLYSIDGSVVTGHEDGIITVDVAEDDDARRARLRDHLGERYRTLLGHFRHEIGHYYWPMLAGSGEALDTFRARFGDERMDYAQALADHYARGEQPPSVWQGEYVSSYASSHPWEDWAETFAHVLHIVGVMYTVDHFGVRIDGDRSDANGTAPEHPGPRAPMADILAAWLPLSVALNAINRAMGLDDLYPFVLSEVVRAKLEDVQQRICEAA